jgi:hypothetical protein
MPATYEPIATTVLSTAATVSFTSISQAYTDLIVIASLKYDLAGTAYGGTFTVNATGGTSYSETIMYSGGATITNGRNTSDSCFRPTEFAGNGSTPFTFMRLDFMNYSNTSTNKTVLRQIAFDRNGAGIVERSVGLFRSTSAITSIEFSLFGITYAVGSTFTLYGIKAA